MLSEPTDVLLKLARAPAVSHHPPGPLMQVVAPHLDLIRAAREQGHGWAEIAATFGLRERKEVATFCTACHRLASRAAKNKAAVQPPAVEPTPAPRSAAVGAPTTIEEI